MSQAGWLNEWTCPIDTCTCPEWSQSAAGVKSSAVLFSCDEASLWGLKEAPVYPLKSLQLGCCAPVGPSHTAVQQYADVARASLSKACSPHFGTDESSLVDHRGTVSPCFTAAWTLVLVVIWVTLCRGQWVHVMKVICSLCARSFRKGLQAGGYN